MVFVDHRDYSCILTLTDIARFIMISFNSTIQANRQNIQHGGNLEDAVKRYHIPKQQWLDLSTGISPWVYPVKALPEQVWQELPPANDALIASAAQYYAVNPADIIATPGSQMAIRLIPQLLEPANVAVPILGYQEHGISWQMANHQTISYRNTAELLDLITKQLVEHIVLINPNNPSGEKLDLSTIEKIASDSKGICMIDEAFIDSYDNNQQQDISSATKISHQHDNLIILRSVGKFFGLAGLRLGFVIGSHPQLPMLKSLLDPWSISHASQQIGLQALQDKQWQQLQTNRIKQQQSDFQVELKKWLNSNNLEHYSMTETVLFSTVFADKKSLKKLHEQLARQGIWTRLGNEHDEPGWLRFGLPKDIAQFEKRV